MQYLADSKVGMWVDQMRMYLTCCFHVVRIGMQAVCTTGDEKATACNQLISHLPKNLLVQHVCSNRVMD